MITNINPSLAFVVPAAGVGARMQANMPKQYIKLHTKTVIEHTIGKLTACFPDAKIIISISPDDAYFDKLCFNDNIIKVAGGKERADSVLNALNYLKDNHPVDWVLVHDAARPLVSQADIIKLVTTCLDSNVGGILATRVKDTIKRGKLFIEQTVSRDSLWQAQTPQMFELKKLATCLNNALLADAIITDEASAIEWAGGKVQLIEGRADNIKLTTPDDLTFAEYLIKNQLSELE
jgi:2-C-methyl-D-erythritol 4-phosphate cytidylyltransferase